MKLPKIVLLAGLIATPLAVAAIADNSHNLANLSANPKNRISETPTDSPTKPGWSSWKLPEQLEGIDWGLSNITLGLALDMEHQCNEAAKGEEFQYWYRLSDMLNYTGNGTLETGCWHDGRFLHTWTVSDARRRGWDWSKPVNCEEIPTIITEGEAEELSEGAIAEAKKLLETKECPGCYLGDANLAKAELGGANLSNAGLSRSNLAGANLSNANLADSYTDGTYFKSANLVGANLEKAVFDRANLACVDLSNANLKEAVFSEANLIRANLQGANLENARLGGTDLSNANLSGANLRGADLEGATLKFTDLCGAIMPDGSENREGCD